MRCATVTGFWASFAARPPIQTAGPGTSRHRRGRLRSPPAGRRWRRPASTLTPSVRWRRMAPARRSVTRSSSRACRRYTAHGQGSARLGEVQLRPHRVGGGRGGFVKAVLELQHGVVPPMVHFNRLPDALAQIETGSTCPRRSQPWPTGGHAGPRRIAVSSYGISGTNVHAIVEQAPETGHGDKTPAPRNKRAPHADPVVLEFRRRTAAYLRPAGRLAGTARGSSCAGGPGLYPGSPARAPARCALR